MRIVGLCEIIDIDESILELVDMSIGFEAARSKKDSDWNIMSSN